jgi:hypothetical protein
MREGAVAAWWSAACLGDKPDPLRSREYEQQDGPAVGRSERANLGTQHAVRRCLPFIGACVLPFGLEIRSIHVSRR